MHIKIKHSNKNKIQSNINSILMLTKIQANNVAGKNQLLGAMNSVSIGVQYQNSTLFRLSKLYIKCKVIRWFTYCAGRSDS